ncbi:zinc finger CCCH domain-containing protein ZFN-like isoform X2 [Ipomoea triloba]|uniref:zinc finger CCCH domain-containing protein ZFN-like isoform X2 n=1 Tax=Ipomoea triloba TaxID=35885 RepID=UPI00125DF755|nr:zinc finger CCCH domain-containing protein ZFN-like isoform X2 [Ipomoea triloba]
MFFHMMDFDAAGISVSRESVSEGPSSFSSSLDQDTLWQIDLTSRQPMESAQYPVRDGEPDCSYYMRTGLCRFGTTCRFNHPPDRRLAIATARMIGEYPERVGQPECQYYLKTGTCKFGITCKFNHPREKAGIAGRVALNVLGYPLRPNETECAYYMRTGQCKFGGTCKFHHPQPSSMMVSLHGSPVYPPVRSPTSPGQLSYPLSRPSFITSPRWQGPSNYSPLMVPPGMVSVPGYAYSGQLGSVSSAEGQKLTAGSSQVYGASRAIERENVFPERPGQPECQFYMKTGDCKFGSVCRFHHPRERLIPPPDCMLSPIGLPLRPGEQICIFYSRYGICKFGPSCKFDHPMGVFAYSLSPSPSTDAPAGQFLLGSSSGTGALTLSSEGLVDAGSTNPRRLPSGDNNIETEE